MGQLALTGIKSVGDSGEEQKLIRTVARRGFRFIGQVIQDQPREEDGVAGPVPSTDAATTLPTSALTLPDKPSIAVLPFQNLSGDSAQEYFADGVVEDIIT